MELKEYANLFKVIGDETRLLIINELISNKEMCACKLLELVDPQNLPNIIGGECTCPHIENGCLYSDIGPWNPRGGIKVGDHDTYIGTK
jgi:hypothetical protein